MSIVHITENTFESEVLKSSTPVLVDFWAEWCGPCKMIAPVLDQIANEYGVRSIPTLMLFKNGVVEAQQVGMLSKDSLKKILDAKL